MKFALGCDPCWWRKESWWLRYSVAGYNAAEVSWPVLHFGPMFFYTGGQLWPDLSNRLITPSWYYLYALVLMLWKLKTERERHRERKIERASIQKNSLFSLFTRCAEMVIDIHTSTWMVYFIWHVIFGSWNKQFIWLSLTRTRLEVSDYLVIPSINVTYSNMRWSYFYQFAKKISSVINVCV